MKTILNLLSPIVLIAAVLLTGCGKLATETVYVQAFRAALDASEPAVSQETSASAQQPFEAVVACSGFPDFPVMGGRVDLPKGAKNCKAKLQALQTRDGRFQPASGSGFTSFVSGELATFTNGNGGLLLVSIASQLPNPISGPASVSYVYTEHLNLGDTLANLKLTASIGVQGEDAPFWQLSSASYGEVSLDLVLQCRSRISGETLASAACDGKAVTSLGISIGDLPATAITQQLLAQFAASEKRVADLSASLMLPGDEIANGGIYVSLPFNGASPKNQLIVLHYPNGQSYLYGAIRFTANPQPAAPQLHVIGVYHGDPYQVVTVTVDTGTETVLGLSAYDRTRFHLDIKPGSSVKKILLSGSAYNTVSNAATGTEVIQLGSQYGYDYGSLRTLAAAFEGRAGMKANSIQGAYESAQFMVRNVAGSAIPFDVEFHYVSVYEPAGSLHNMDPKPVNVDVNRPNKKVVLVLSTYESVRWKVSASVGTEIVGIITTGYKGSVVEGAATPYLFGAYTGDSGAYQYPSIGASSLITRIGTILGRPSSATSYQGAYTGSSFQVR